MIIEFVGNILTVMIALWLYDKISEWQWFRRYHGRR